MLKIAFFDTKPYDRNSFLEANAAFNCKFIFHEARLTPDTATIAKGAEVVCAFVNDDINAECINILYNSGVKLLAMRCAGYNNVDLAAAAGKISVVRVPEYSPYAVAEYTIGLILSLNRHLHRAFCRVRENNFSINGFLGFDLHEKTIGVIGTGKIGRSFGKVLQGFGMEVLAYDPYPTAEAEKLGMKYVTLDELYRRSDIISLHCPLTPENHHLINSASICKMKLGVMLINTSRGALICAPDLIAALKSGQVGSAGLDVYEEETDYFFEDYSGTAVKDDILARLMTFPNVMITSHQAFFTEEALANIANITLKNIELFFSTGAMPNGICNKCDGSKCSRCPK
ncbi:MAG: 2-hydroxyacid dehydrogenase [Lentisphaeria bacterium]|nr:2-hydroxyacid dehydrogenase [Lentisphaeria bacterium]